MARFNKGGIPQVGPQSVVTSTTERVLTHEGARGYARDAKSELFLLAASFMGGDDNFYEKSSDRYERLIALVNEVELVADPDWAYNFVMWLRKEANMRTVAMVVAVEYVRARLARDETDAFSVKVGSSTTYVEHTNRDIVSVALQRADEPAEMFAYWLHKYGKMIPQPVKNGVSDAAIRLYNEFSYLKYGKSRSSAVTMMDVLRLTHAVPKDEKQNALFNVIVGKSDVEGYEPGTLPMIHARTVLYNLPTDVRRVVDPITFKQAGMTWENLSEWLPGGMDAEAWELAIPNMGIMALIRNLRNFDEAGISKLSAMLVEQQIRDPEIVRRSRQLPFRWYQAYRATDSLRYGMALEEALDYSLVNIPTMRGKTLVLVDMSGSMGTRVSDRSVVTYADAASLFGTALKLANPHGVDLYQFGSDYNHLVGRYINRQGREFGSDGKAWNGVTKEIDLRTGGSILRGMSKFHDMGGTEIHKAVAETMSDKYDRVILLTDEQGWSAPNYDDLPIPAGKSLYVWNLAGYQAGISRSGRYQRHTFGGLSDSAFKLIPILEAGRNSGWPWEIREENGQAQQEGTVQ